MVHSAPLPEPPASLWRRAIATPKKKPAASRRGGAKPAAKAPAHPTKGARASRGVTKGAALASRGVTKGAAHASRGVTKGAAHASRGVADGGHPLGMGVADGYAMKRLKAPARLTRTPRKAVREIGWAAFGEVARALAATIAADFRPDTVVGVAKGGVFVGGALAAALQADFQPVRIEKRRRDVEPMPEANERLPDLTGRRVLVVDDVSSTGSTLAKTRALCRKAGARQVRTAVLVKRPGGARPDWFALETDELILFGWDYQLEGAGQAALDPGEVGV